MQEDLERPSEALKGLRTRTEMVCAGEMERLASRAPGLTEAQQRVVRRALDDLAERLLLSRARGTDLPPALIAELFGTGAQSAPRRKGDQ